MVHRVAVLVYDSVVSVRCIHPTAFVVAECWTAQEMRAKPTDTMLSKRHRSYAPVVFLVASDGIATHFPAIVVAPYCAVKNQFVP